MRYEVTVRTEVTLVVEADNRDDAAEIAGATAWEYDADRLDVIIIKEWEG